jgi:hypothetical protein
MTTPCAPSAAAAARVIDHDRDRAAVTRAIAGAFHAIAEEDDAVFDGARGQCLQGLEILDHQGFGFDPFGGCAHAATQRQCGHALWPRCDDGKFRLAAHPLGNGDFRASHVCKAEPLHFPQGPGHRGLVARGTGRARADLGGER